MELFELFSDILINPMSILELFNKIESINIREMFFALPDSFKVIKKHEHYSCNFLLAEEVHDLGNLFNQSKSIILEEGPGKFVVTKNPEHTCNIVANLRLLQAWSV